MTRAGIVLTLGLIASVAAAALPSPAAAEQRQQHRERRGSDRSRHDDRPDLRRRHHHHHRHHHRHHARPFVTFYSLPSAVYYTYYSPPPVYYAPPVYQAPPVSYTPPAIPRVVEYPTGRYELRGDGVTTPYEWAWIPNPPPAPPPPVEPPATAPPSLPAPITASASREAFRWTDDNGVTTWTDRLDTVPERYRAQVHRLR
jgi:Ni/Co efflux regulator RcnB